MSLSPPVGRPDERLEGLYKQITKHPHYSSLTTAQETDLKRASSLLLDLAFSDSVTPESEEVAEAIHSLEKVVQELSRLEGPVGKEGWKQPNDLPPVMPTAPPMPSDLLPVPFRDWISDTAERLSVHLEMIAIPAIVAAAASIGRSAAIYPKAYDTGWVEAANLWGALVAPPSARKTPAITAGTKPLRLIEGAIRDAHVDAESKREVQRQIIDMEIKQLKAAASSKGGSPSSITASLLTKQQQLKELEVSEPRLVVNDTTIEKLGELLAENPRGLLYLRDELMGLLKSTEKSGHENDRPFLLEAWNGKNGYTFDRIGRGTLHIPAVNLSLLGGIQPGKLREYTQGAIRGGSGADGLLQRFQLLVWPDRAQVNRHVDRQPDGPAFERANTIFVELREIGSALEQSLTFGGEEVPTLHFAPDAQSKFDDWVKELDREINSTEVASAPAFQSHLVKYLSLVPRLALVFHLIDIADGDPIGPVSVEATRLAIKWSGFLKAHARKIYAEELQRDLSRAHDLARLIEQGDITDEMNVRDIYKRWFAGQSDEAERALVILEQHAWVRVEERTNVKARPSKFLRINPSVQP